MLNPMDSPFPVVACETLHDDARRSRGSTGGTNAYLSDVGAVGDVPLESFFSSSDLDAPACVRPESGREPTAYLAFILQNYGNLPEYMYFLHGHESRYSGTETCRLEL